MSPHGCHLCGVAPWAASRRRRAASVEKPMKCTPLVRPASTHSDCRRHRRCGPAAGRCVASSRARISRLWPPPSAPCAKAATERHRPACSSVIVRPPENLPWQCRGWLGWPRRPAFLERRQWPRCSSRLAGQCRAQRCSVGDSLASATAAGRCAQESRRQCRRHCGCDNCSSRARGFSVARSGARAVKNSSSSSRVSSSNTPSTSKMTRRFQVSLMLSPRRHSGERRNLFRSLRKIPAFAGMTVLKSSKNFTHSPSVASSHSASGHLP